MHLLDRRFTRGLVAVVMVACGPGDSGGIDDTPLALINLGVTLERFAPGAGRAGDVVFLPEPGLRAFGEFGQVVADQAGGSKQLPEFDFTLDAASTVISPVDGVVVSVVDQPETNDVEIQLRRRELDAVWVVTLDHVVDPVVLEGATVRAGDPIARGGAHSFELLVADFDFFYCPTDFLGAEVRDEIRQQLRDLMADFESFRGDTTRPRSSLRPAA